MTLAQLVALQSAGLIGEGMPSDERSDLPKGAEWVQLSGQSATMRASEIPSSG